MKTSLLILACFLAGILCGWQGIFTVSAEDGDAITLVLLYILMSCVGISVGCDRRLGEILRTLHPRVLLYPLGTTIGTFASAFFCSMVLAYPLSHSLAVHAGFAYYSLSSILISQAVGPELGTVALIANLSRELLTMLFVPLAAKFLAPPAVIALGGATTMDCTLPIITRTLGTQWVFISIVHAIVLDFSVPFWVLFFCSL